MGWAQRQLIAEEWAHFYNAAFPAANANEKLQQMLNVAFYAGAHAMLFRLVRALAEERVDVIDDLNAELTVFIQAVLDEGANQANKGNAIE